jgi:hypothetical protein
LHWSANMLLIVCGLAWILLLRRRRSSVGLAAQRVGVKVAGWQGILAGTEGRGRLFG